MSLEEVDGSGMVRNEMMCRKSSGGMRGEGAGGDIPLVCDTGVSSGYLKGRSGNMGDCGDLKERTSMLGEVTIESEGDCRCSPGAVGISVMAMVRRSN
jgi:hypothetical protein